MAPTQVPFPHVPPLPEANSPSDSLTPDKRFSIAHLVAAQYIQLRVDATPTRISLYSLTCGSTQRRVSVWPMRL